MVRIEWKKKKKSKVKKVKRLNIKISQLLSWRKKKTDQNYCATPLGSSVHPCGFNIVCGWQISFVSSLWKKLSTNL